MRQVRIPILEEEKLSIYLIGTHNGNIRGYEINSTFFWKKDKENFISQLKKELNKNRYEEIILKIEENEIRQKKRRLKK